MIIGLTYDLRQEYLDAGYGLEETAEFDKPDTIEGIETALQNLGHETRRIGNIKSLVGRLAAGERWDLVFNICEGMFGLGREAQVPALLDAYEIPYTFSGPLILALALDKGLTKRVLRSFGIPTPDFAVVATPADIAAVDLPLPLFVKPVAEGTGKGIDARSKINSRKQLQEVCAALLKKFRQPVLVEAYLPGREFTVGITGSGDDARAIGVMEVMLNAEAEANAYSYINKEQYEERVQYALAPKKEAAACVDVALRAWRGLDCLDGGRVDVKMDRDGVVNFIEVNPLAGLNPIHSDLPILCRLQNISYQELIGRILDSAARRLPR
ncbi:MAG: D-alanine--D-alanine ligase [Acidobacteria bacterium]|nr:D-alanine--D-alanine ligase [Acidobacteriota bacterium]